MGSSFHDEPSLVEAVGSLRFNAINDPNSTLGMGTCIGEDGNLDIGLDDPSAGLKMANISQERGDSDDIGESDDIQMVYRWNYRVK